MTLLTLKTPLALVVVLKLVPPEVMTTGALATGCRFSPITVPETVMVAGGLTVMLAVAVSEPEVAVSCTVVELAIVAGGV
ncbi:putative acetyltransferase [Meiothermus ruber H328]|nr:putative acetyltransferase [Meiothermus ruber H328]